MTVASTSIEAYRSIQSDGTLTKRQQQVMEVIKEGRDYSLQELVMLCGLPINCVSARVNELHYTLHSLEAAPSRRCTITGRTVHPVRLPVKQLELL